MTDFAALRLQAKGDPQILDEILQQECRQRFGTKLSNTLREIPDFRFPSLLAGEQATSDVLADEHAAWVKPSSRVLDMTCGLGIDALHFAKSGCQVTAIEADPTKAECAAGNFAGTGLQISVICDDSVKWLQQYDGPRFDVIFIDPARRTTSGRAYSLSDCTPNVLEFLPLMLKHGKRVIIKASPMLDIEKTRLDLGHDADIITVGTPTECRELCASLPGTRRLTAVTLTRDRRVSVDLGTGPQTPAGADPQPGQYLCEPWPPVMKAGQPARVAYITGTIGVAPNTHLFISDTPPQSFPGKVYRIDEVYPSGKAAFRSLKGIAAQIAVRNYPMRADELAKRLKATQSDTRRLYALTAPAGHLLVVTTPTL